MVDQAPIRERKAVAIAGGITLLPMTDPDELETRWPRVAARFVAWGIFAVVLYVLSIGPVVWAFQARSSRINAAIDFAYTPMWSSFDRFPGFHDLMLRYVMWWVLLPGGPVSRPNQMPDVPKLP